MPILKITSENNGDRLDVVLAKAYPEYSRSFLKRVILDGGVKLGSSIPTPSDRVRAGDTYEVRDLTPLVEEFKFTDAAAEDMGPTAASNVGVAPSILFEDPSMLVINKPAGLVVHPAGAHHGVTLIDWLRKYLGGKGAKEFSDPNRLGLVHRLDKDTSGVLMIAKNVIAQTALSRQFRDRTIQKTYGAFIEGVPSNRRGEISAPVGRSHKNPARMAVSNHGRPSETTFEVIETLKEVSQVRLYPKTGRTHQIRVHVAAIGHPIIGDLAYGAKGALAERFGVTRTLLHAERLDLTHPVSKKKIHFEAVWPKDFKDAQRRFRAAAKAAVLVLLLGGALGRLQADDTTAAPAKKTTPVKHTTSSGGNGSASSGTATAVRALKKDVASLKESLQTLQQQIAALQNDFDNANAAQHFRDYDHALAELNAKAVNGSTTVEETKTQVLDLSRKMKSQQDMLDQIRDQIDRFQHELIQLRSKAESEPVSSGPVTGDTGRENRTSNAR
jgi:23S rRNA pseudouridine1911/1915/1917 synthase